MAIVDFTAALVDGDDAVAGAASITRMVAFWNSVLVPAAIEANLVPFTRSGGRTLGGLERVARTDRGYWRIGFRGMHLYTELQRRMYNALAQHAGGMAGLLVIPVYSHDALAWPEGVIDGQILTPHSDGSPHSDSTPYSQDAFGVTSLYAAEIGDTSITLRVEFGVAEPVGVRFSYNHALYRTGFETLRSGNDWTVPISPAIRAPIPAGAELEFGLPTCLVRLASDQEMDARFSAGRFDLVDVNFVECVDFWNALAADDS